MARKSSSSKSTKSNSSDIRFIRLVTGEDIVAEVTDVANGKMIINNPLKIVYAPSVQTGFLSISLMQWVFTRISRNQTFNLDLHNILVMTQADDALEKHYKESLDTFDTKNFETEYNDYTEESDEFDTLEPDKGLEMLKNLMDKIKNNKGKLH
jgi:hypothetical protein